jgi:hypothetical protein
MAAVVTTDLGASFAPGSLEGTGLEHAKATVAAAVATLEQLADDGWRSILGDSPDGRDRVRLGADSVAERTESFDPFGKALATVG